MRNKAKVLVPSSSFRPMFTAVFVTGLAFASWLAFPIVWETDSNADRIPLAAVQSEALIVDEARCAECHADITAAYHTAPHSRTLRQGTDPEVIARFLGRSFLREETGVEYSYIESNGMLMVRSSAYAQPLPIEWVVGSGTHASTPLVTIPSTDQGTSMIEHVVSWYPSGELGITLGMEELLEKHGILALGHPRPPEETINCFGCHSTFVPVRDERIDFDHLQAGVGCARCHWGLKQHLFDMDHTGETTIERFSELSPSEAIDRCGECHRRASELGGEIRPEDETLIRFAPVGLSKSPCFLNQDSALDEQGNPIRFDCASCHDPHGPTNPDWRFHTAVCNRCHDAESEHVSGCSVENRESNCLPCHMPSVPANDFLNFTDHWIRIRENPRRE